MPKARPLPFKLAKESPTVVDVGNQYTGIISLQKKGCLEVGAETEIADYSVNLAPNESLSSAKKKIASIFLKYRHDPEWTEADTTAQIEDFGLVEAIYDFASSERNRWRPKDQLLEIKGADAETLAIAYAKEKSAVAASREDLDSWFVFQNRLATPTDLELVHDFSEPIEIADVAVGKGSKSTGPKGFGSSDSTTQTNHDSALITSPGA